MNNMISSLTDGAERLLRLAPALLLLPLLLYAVSDEAERTVDSLILQTPAKGLVGGGYDYYPGHLEDEDIVIKYKTYVDPNGEEYTGAVIEVRKPVTLATPEDTGSMQPMFGAGNTLIQEKVDGDTVLSKGDIIVYDYNSTLIIHQIVDEKDGCYTTKGIINRR
jgi:hypothetical protein